MTQKNAKSAWLPKKERFRMINDGEVKIVQQGGRIVVLVKSKIDNSLKSLGVNPA